MAKEQEDKKDNSRRNFLKKVGLISVGVVAGGGAIFSATNFEKGKNASGKKTKLLTQDNKLVEVDSLAMTLIEKAPADVLQSEGRDGIAGKRWVMVVDLSQCKNARKCIGACQSAHHLYPYQFHINVLQIQDTPKTKPYHMSKPCQHCDNPPCVSVCPVDATFKRQDGIVLIDNERCIGCRFCMAACPYSARTFQWVEPKDAEKDQMTTYNVELNVPQKKGTITKCLFSADQLRVNKLPYCVSACPNGVYYFGDENEDAVTNGTSKETVRLSKLLEDNAGYQLMPELGTKPRVYYLPPKNRTLKFNTTEDKIESEII
ncbi:MAG: 4Fe-4S dicluster domain-containing protein [Bacteroidota bacterium]